MLNKASKSKYSTSTLRWQAINYLSRKMVNPIAAQEIIENPGIIYKLFTKSELAVIEHVVWLSHKYPILFVSQQRIADALELSREHVNRAIKKAAKYGLLAKQSREYDSCIYKTASLFFEEKLRPIFEKTFRIARVLPFLLLYSVKAYSEGIVTLGNKKSFIINQSTIVSEGGQLLPPGIKETRVEKMESWKPMGAIEVTTNDKLFKDHRYKSNFRDDESNSYYKKPEMKVGSTKSELNFIRERSDIEARLKREQEARFNRLSWVLSEEHKEYLLGFATKFESSTTNPHVKEMMRCMKKLGENCFNQANKQSQQEIIDPLLELSRLTIDEIRERMRRLPINEQNMFMEKVMEARKKYAF